MHLTVYLALKPVGWEQKELIGRGAGSGYLQGPSWRRSKCILVFGNSDLVSSAPKVLFQFKTVPSGFTPVYSVKGLCYQV